MYKDHWGLTEMPFENVPNPRFYYPSRKHEEALSRLLYGIRQNKGALMVTGEIGSGKTLLSRTLIQRLSQDRFDVVLVQGPSSRGIELLQEILSHMTKEPIAKTGWELRQAFRQRLTDKLASGKETVIVLDEAQVINDRETFEELRLLLNFQMDDRFLLTLVLLGQPELRHKVSLIDQLNQRIEVRYHLRAFEQDETIGYVDFRLKIAGLKDTPEGLFQSNALLAIHKHSHGIPRNINKLCDLSLLTAFIAKSRIVDAKTVERVVLDQYG